MNIELCPECGVPEQISHNYQWLNSGVMVQSNDITRRVGFLESENLDPLYAGIGTIIGMPIDRLVIDISRRGTVEYFNTLIPPKARGAVRRETLGVDSIAAFMTTMGQLNGFGKYEITDILYDGSADEWDSRPRVTSRSRSPRRA